jgi:hypothetical protein
MGRRKEPTVSNVYAKSIQGCVIADPEEAFERASRNANRALRSRRKGRSKGRLTTLLLALATSGFASAVAFLAGPALSQSAFGLAVSGALAPLVDVALNAGAIEYLIAGAFVAIVGLVCYIRG